MKTAPHGSGAGIAVTDMDYYWNPNGTRKEMDTAVGDFTYDYDEDGRYASMTCSALPSGYQTASATYYDNGWQETRTLPNGIGTSYSYNAVGALTALTNGSTISAFSSFAYDGMFNMTGFSAAYNTGSANGSRTFGYDTKDRMTSAYIPENDDLAISMSYNFDSAGNRTYVSPSAITFNSDNQLSISGYSFDGNGPDSLRSFPFGGISVPASRDSENPTTYATHSLTFDPENRMTAYGSVSSATYRADGLRASKTVSSTTTYFVYDGSEPIIEMNSSGTVTALNVFAPDGLVARQASSTIEYVFDQQGSVAERTDTSGTVLNATQYSSWGGEMSISGSTQSDPFGYNAQAGYYLDRDTGLYLCQNRFYDPSNGRWLNRDPIGFDGGTNLYAYCVDGPTGWVDPGGEEAMPAYTNALELVEGGGGEAAGATGGAAGVTSGAAATPVLVAAGTLAVAVAIGLGLGYALGTGIDHVTGGRFGHWWYNALGGQDAPDELDYQDELSSRKRRKNGDHEHTKNATPSNLPRHQKGKATRKRDAGGEKGDKRRPPGWFPGSRFIIVPLPVCDSPRP